MFFRRLRNFKPYRTETTEARVRLSSNELPFSIPPDLMRKVSEEIASSDPSKYPDPSAGALKEVLADFFGVNSNNIVLGNGSDELIYYLSAVVGEQSEAVLITEPTFPMYAISGEVMGRTVVSTLLDGNFDIDLPSCLESASSIPFALSYFAFPNNPTGNLYTREKITTLRDQGVFTVIDEAYYHYSGETFLDDALSREDTAVLRTLSKIGMAGLRVGILIAKEEIASEIEKVRLPFNISQPSQIMASVILREGRDFIEESVGIVVKERERLFKELKEIDGVIPFPSRANFILFKTEFPAQKVYGSLLRRGILVRDVSYMPLLERCLRVSVGKPEENDAFLEALSSSLRELQ